MSQTGNIESFFANKFGSLVSAANTDEKILVSFNGMLSQEQVAKLESEVETKINEEGIPKGPLKKIFFISVETLQNMLIHGSRDEEGKQYNFFILTKNGVKTCMTSANLVHNKNIPGLENQITKINSFEDPSGLKQYYMEHLENNQLSAKGGAGLGFITIAMKSGNKLKYGFDKISEDASLFWLTSTVSSE
ncbi:MAG TPA: SiaB family protein kinase [Bacteroidia bacterium]|nr:SiaB family protein kinase [Bacteroidia bacterium]